MLSILTTLGSYRWLIGDWLEHHMGAITAVIAVAAIVQWRETRKTAQRQLRAYVGITTGSLGFETIKGVPKPQATLRIKNFGGTPAYEVSGSAWIENAEKFSESMNQRLKPIAGKDIIFPDDSRRIQLGGDFNIPPGDGPVRTFIFGRITYKDAFGHDRWIKFRCTARILPGVVSADLTPCEEGNDAN